MVVSIFWDGTAAPLNAVPTVANSGGASGPAMSSVVIAAGDSIIFTDFPGFPYGGHIGMSLIAAGAGATRCHWLAAEAVGTRICATFFYACSPSITAIEDICMFRHSGGNLAILTIGADSKIVPQHAGGGTLNTFKAANPIEASILCRLGLAVTPGTSTTNGRIEWAYWADPMNVGAPDEYQDTGATTNVGTSNATSSFCIGRSTGRAQAHEPYYGLISVQTLASGWPAPPTVPGANPIARLEGNKTVEPFEIIELDASASQPLNGATISSYAFSKISGPTIVGGFSGSGSAVTYRVPGVSTQTDLVLQVLVTDSNGLTSTAQCTHTILQANEYSPVSGAAQPLNVD